MFNTYNAGDVRTNLKINACSGGIYKTYKESWFKRFHLQSNLAETLFRKSKCFYNEQSNEYTTTVPYLETKNFSEVILLQMIICGEMEVIAELILKEDLEKYFENEEAPSNVETVTQ